MVINMKYEKQSKHFRGTAPLLTYYTEDCQKFSRPSTPKDQSFYKQMTEKFMVFHSRMHAAYIFSITVSIKHLHPNA